MTSQSMKLRSTDGSLTKTPRHTGEWEGGGGGGGVVYGWTIFYNKCNNK